MNAPPLAPIKTTSGNCRCGSSAPYALIQLGVAYTLHWIKSCHHELEDGGGKHGQPHSIYAPRDFSNPFRVLTLTLINTINPITYKSE
jgi:hypothetical protein